MTNKNTISLRKYGFVTILEELDNPGGGKRLKCKCDCGKEFISPASRVLSGHRKTCGCRSFGKIAENTPLYKEIVVNGKYGKLTTLEKIIKQSKLQSHRSQTWWVCRCECGQIKNVRQNHIKFGNVTSCGCLRVGVKNPNWMGYNELPKRYFRRVKRGAATRNLTFNISIKDMWDQFIKQDKKCALSGIPLNFPSLTSSSLDGNASLDRIDSTRGYEKDNIQWLEKKLNIIKMDLPEDQLITLCGKIVDYQNQKPQETLLGVADYNI